MGIETALIASALVTAGATVAASQSRPKISAPKQPSAIATGDLLAESKSQKLSEEEIEGVAKSTKKARQGTKQFQVELKKSKGSGLNIPKASTNSNTSLNI